MPSGAYPQTSKYDFTSPAVARAKIAKVETKPEQLVADAIVTLQHAQPTARDLARYTGLPTETVERVEDKARAIAFKRIHGHA